MNINYIDDSTNLNPKGKSDEQKTNRVDKKRRDKERSTKKSTLN